MTGSTDVSRRWRELTSTQRSAVVAVAAIDACLRAWALVDIARRPADTVRGPKAAWVAVLAVVNSAGIAPLAYFARGRRPR